MNAIIKNWLDDLYEHPFILLTGCGIEYDENDRRQNLSFGKTENGEIRIRLHQGFFDLMFESYNPLELHFPLDLAFYHEMGHLHSYFYRGRDPEIFEREFLSSSRNRQKELLLDEESYAWDLGYDLYCSYNGSYNDVFYERKELIKNYLIDNLDIYLDETLKYNNINL